MKKLNKSNNNTVFTGVIGGIGEYLDIDPVFLRLIWVVIVLLSGIFPGVIVYIIVALIIPHNNNAEVNVKSQLRGRNSNINYILL